MHINVSCVLIKIHNSFFINFELYLMLETLLFNCMISLLLVYTSNSQMERMIEMTSQQCLIHTNAIKCIIFCYYNAQTRNSLFNVRVFIWKKKWNKKSMCHSIKIQKEWMFHIGGITIKKISQHLHSNDKHTTQ